ncbi:MAG: hypothetical protein HFF86_06000 [Oscillibacter sp.]|nr:hypothetical protein [Oscillibacter sp.]
MDYKKSYYLMSVGIWGGGIVVLIGMFLGTAGPGTMMLGNVIAGIGVAAMLLGIGQALVFYKCPHCGEKFNIRGKKPDYCPKCSCKLDL